MENRETTLTEELIKKAPKVLLHDHLDGGLRPETIIDLANTSKFKLPESDPVRLAKWFHRGANRGSLTEYLKGFSVTTGVMQSEEALYRVSYEMMEDMYRDGLNSCSGPAIFNVPGRRFILAL